MDWSRHAKEDIAGPAFFAAFWPEELGSLKTRCCSGLSLASGAPDNLFLSTLAPPGIMLCPKAVRSEVVYHEVFRAFARSCFAVVDLCGGIVLPKNGLSGGCLLLKCRHFSMGEAKGADWRQGC